MPDLTRQSSRRLASSKGRVRIERPGAASPQWGAYRAFALDADLGECPLWCARERVLICLDIAQGALHRIDPARGECAAWSLPVRSTAIVASSGLTLVVAMGDALVEWSFDAGTMRTIARLVGESAAHSVFNDAKCDRAGRLWIGTRHRDRLPGAGALWRCDADRGLCRIDGDYTMPNGIAWSPRGDVLYVADSRAKAIVRYAVDAARGDARDRSVFARFTEHDAAPDGLTVDAEGHLWVALWGGSSLRRYAPDGTIERRIVLPMPRPTSCTFGGADMSELYVTSATTPAGERAQGAAAQHEGALLVLRTGFRGIAETPMQIGRVGAS